MLVACIWKLAVCLLSAVVARPPGRALVTPNKRVVASKSVSCVSTSSHLLTLVEAFCDLQSVRIFSDYFWTWNFYVGEECKNEDKVYLPIPFKARYGRHRRRRTAPQRFIEGAVFVASYTQRSVAVEMESWSGMVSSRFYYLLNFKLSVNIC